MKLLDSFPSAPARAAIGFDFLTDEDLNAFTYAQIASGTAAIQTMDLDLTAGDKAR